MTHIRSLCVYCGSQAGRNDSHRSAAARLGQEFAAHDVRLVYGGGRNGLMGTLAKAVLAAGGEVTGVIPRHLDNLEIPLDTLTELLVVEDMHTRKRTMFERSDAFAVLPGGLGTLDETFEIITWRQLGLHDKPILLIDNDGYWRPLVSLIEHAVREGFAAKESLQLFEIVPSIEAIFPALKLQPRPRLAPAPERF